MQNSYSKQDSSIAFVTIISFMVATKCFYFTGLSDWGGWRYYLWGAILLLLILQSSTPIKYIKKPCFSIVFICILCPVISSVPCYLFHGQSFFDSIRAIIGLSYPWLLYFYLHKYKAPPRTIIKIICILGIIWTFLEIIQQFTYPSYWFASRGYDSKEEVALRNGVWRYMIQPWFIGYLAGVYYWFRYLNYRRIRDFLLMLLCLVGVYLYVTRVIIASILFVILMSFLFVNKIKLSRKLTVLLLMLIASIPIYLYWDLFFGEFYNQTVEQYENSDTDTRMLAILFYGYDYFPSTVCNFFGNGIPLPFSSYGKEIISYEEIQGLYRSDIGIIGDYNLYGGFYIICLFFALWKFFSSRKHLQSYQIYTMIGLLLTYYIIPIFQEQHRNIVIAMFFYLCDYSYSNSILNSQIRKKEQNEK